MNYKLDRTELIHWGVLPARGEGGGALSGMFDFPKRTGSTERNWGNSIEPYVAADDLAFGDRKLELKVVMTDLSRLDDFRKACLDCRLLSCELGDYPVIVADEIQVERMNSRLATATIKFIQQEIQFPELTLVGSKGSGYCLDDYHLEKDFSIRISAVTGDLNIPKRIEVNTTAPSTENRYREHNVITLECTMTGNGLPAIAGKMAQFHALCAQPGLRQLVFPDGRRREIYVKDGFSVKTEDERLVTFSLKMEAL